jgi:hypothetical protein
LHSFGVGKTQILWKISFQDGGWNEKIRLSRHLGFFEKPFSHKNCIFLTPNECKKIIEKM